MIEIRQATEQDIDGIREIFLACYDQDYMYQSYYDELGLKKIILGDDTLVLVAADTDTNEVLGTASVILASGAYTDLVGEFGRLAVHPKARRRGLAGRLLEARVERVEKQLHVGYMEARVAHRFSVDNALSHGFRPVGHVPLKDVFGRRRESTAYLVRYFEGALDLRRNHPRLIPEAYPLACAAMESAGLANDVVVDDSSAPYTSEQHYDVERLNSAGYSSLLRIERGRLRRREVFGPLRLHYGFFKLKSADSNYLIARRDGHVAAAVGYTLDQLEKSVRVFELISLDDLAVRFLLEELLSRSQEGGDVALIEIDVSAYAPRMQRTLYELGFLPTAYIPALAFHRVERLDILKMARLFVPFSRDGVELAPATEHIAELVLQRFEQGEVLPRLRRTVGSLELLDGLTEEQLGRFASACSLARFDAGEVLFDAGTPSDQIFVLLDGSVAVDRPDDQQLLGTVTAGEALGEIAVLTNTPHSARARAREGVVAGVLPRPILNELVRQRPDIGVTLFRNLARGLGGKLRRLDESVTAPATETR